MVCARIKSKLIISIIIASLVFTPVFVVSAEDVQEIENQIKEKNDIVKNLENQAEKYKDVIKELQIVQQTLQNEIELLDAQIAQLNIEIQTTQSKIDQTNLEIKNYEIRIQTKEDEIIKEKDILKMLIRKINEYDSESSFEILLKKEKFSDFVNQSDYVGKVEEKIKNALDALKLMKKELEQEKKEMEDKKASLEALNSKLSGQKEDADSQKKNKNVLLEETKGKENKYQDLLFNVRNQRKTILGDINELKRKMESEIARIAAMAERPSENLASTNWYFSQNDSRWKDMSIGFSNSTVDDYGCALASVSMVFKYYGIDIDPGRLSKQPIFYYDLIVWSKQWRYIDLIKNSFHKSSGLNNDDWSLIDREIASGHPVIVFIKALGRNAGHYVVIHSKDKKGYVVHDPVMWNNQSGANIYLSTTRKYLESIYKTNTIIDQYVIYH